MSGEASSNVFSWTPGTEILVVRTIVVGVGEKGETMSFIGLMVFIKM